MELVLEQELEFPTRVRCVDVADECRGAGEYVAPGACAGSLCGALTLSSEEHACTWDLDVESAVLTVREVRLG
jgi:hypothetical protein